MLEMSSPSLSALDVELRGRIEGSVGRKFGAYMTFTRDLKRSVFQSCDDGTATFLYPEPSLLSDLVVFWSMFCEFYELVNRSKGALAVVLDADPRLANRLGRMTFEFWHSPNGGTLSRANKDSLSLTDLVKTLRNGYSHFHWRYADLSADEYWADMGWDQSHPLAQTFDLSRFARHNYRAFIADGRKLEGVRFWEAADLRIMVTDYAHLRWGLHQLLNLVLNDSETNVFGSR